MQENILTLNARLNELINDYLIALYLYQPRVFSDAGVLLPHVKRELNKLMLMGDEQRLLTLVSIGEHKHYDLGITTEVAGGQIFRITFDVSEAPNPTLSVNINNRILI